jgi:hypothetical protein
VSSIGLPSGTWRASSPIHTLQPTALVDEAFVRLVDQRHVAWQNRAHFYNLAATLMRRILVDHARHAPLEASAGVVSVSLDETGAAPQPGELDLADVLMLDRALDELRALDARQCQIAPMCTFTTSDV